MSVAASIAANDVGIIKSCVTQSGSSQGMGDSHRGSDADLYGAISAIEGPHLRPISCLSESLSPYTRLGVPVVPLGDWKAAISHPIHFQHASLPLRI